MEATDNAPPAEESRVTVRLPSFWAERTKFCHFVSQFDHHFTSEVEDIITSPPEQEPYTLLRTELVS
jgi:hypothetical protein